MSDLRNSAVESEIGVGETGRAPLRVAAKRHHGASPAVRSALSTQSSVLIPQSSVLSPHRAGGFTLVELVVSMGILVGLMTMVGMIFSMATRAASTGTATMSVYRALRMARQVIERDLKNFDPTDGVLAIYGWEQLAHATADDQSSGRALDANRIPNGDPEANYRAPFDYHRADVLMLTTSTRTPPYAVNAPDVVGTGQILVYGHADLGQISSENSWDPADHQWTRPEQFDRIENGRQWYGTLGAVVGNRQSMAPASRWHLARRVTALTTADTGEQDAIGPWTNYNLTDIETRDRIYRAGDGAQAGGGGGPGGDLLDRFDLDQAMSLWASDANEGVPDNWYYPDVASTSMRTVLDLTPPPGQQGRFAYQFLSGCVEFKVEVTFDTPEMVWGGPNTIQPPGNWFTVPSGSRIEWVRGVAVGLNDNQSVTQNRFNRSWLNVIYNPTGPQGQRGAYELVEDALRPNAQNPPFPAAVRITLRIMDTGESLYAPQYDPSTGNMSSDGAITETIVHRF